MESSLTILTSGENWQREYENGVRIFEGCVESLAGGRQKESYREDVGIIA
jgi:hypothetical protein